MSAAEWNAAVPVGTPVHWIRTDGTVFATRTDRAAETLDSGLAVVGLEESALPVLLSHVRPSGAHNQKEIR